MADDFADKFSTPVVHVKWWGSYLNNFVNPNFAGGQIPDLVREDDRRSTKPIRSAIRGTPLLNQIVRRGPIAPGSGTFTEMPISGGGPPLKRNAVRVQRRVAPRQGVLPKARHGVLAEDRGASSIFRRDHHRPNQPPTVCASLGLAQPRLHDHGSARFDAARRVAGRTLTACSVRAAIRSGIFRTMR